jgi:hypothetical protein
LRGSSRGSSHRSSLTTSPPSRIRLPRHVARLVVDYFAFTARPGASARRAARHAARRRLLRLAQARRRLHHRSFGCLGTLRDSSRGSSCRSSSTTLRVRVPRHIARLVVDYSASHSLVIDYSVRHDFVLRPHWLYFSHAVGRDYLPCGNTGSTSSTPRAATTSSSGCIVSTIHLD